MSTPGQRLKEAIKLERPLQMVGVINAYSALLAEQTGYRALYLSGAGVANASCGVPDLGITTLADVITDVQRITEITSLPLLVDADTGWGSAFNIERAVKQLTRAGAAGLHLEDQVQAKRCGHRPRKQLVDSQEMCDRIKAAVDARTDPDFVIMARTDAFASEGLTAAINRAKHYIAVGADMVFAEALSSIEDFQQFTKEIKVPVLANITEFGKTPLLPREQLAQAGVAIALYPLSAFRAMSKAALAVYQTIRDDGTQKTILQMMQTREELYKVLNYYQYEQKLDELFK